MRSRIFGSVCLSLGIVSTLLGDVTTSYYNGGSDYSWHIEHMPDFDQKRDGLAVDANGVPGGMYCVPTSSANLLAYMASHGFPSIGPEFADWEAEEDYEEVTEFIDDLGDRMLTSGTSGTVTPYFTMLTEVKEHTDSMFTVEQEIWTPLNTVTLEEMACSGISDNAIQVFCYGTYEDVGTNSSGEQVIFRNGGHCMTLVGAERNGTDAHIWAANPSNNTNTSTQANFSNSNWDVQRMDNVVIAPTIGLSYLTTSQNMDRIMRGDSRYRLIDYRVAVRPVGCTSWGDFQEGESTISVARFSADMGQILSNSIASSLFRPTKMLKTPGGKSVLLERTAQGPLQAWFLRDDNQESGMEPAAIGPLPGDTRFRDICFSKDRTLLVLADDQRLYGLPDYDDGGLDADLKANPENYVLMSGLQGIQQIAHDTQTGTTYLLDRTSRRLLIADRSFENVIEKSIPNVVPLDPQGDGGVDFKCDAMGNLFFNVEGSNQLWKVHGETGEAVMLGELMTQELRGYDFDDHGNLLVNDAGVVRCFTFTEQGLQETGNEGSPFAGLAVGNGLSIDRASTNYDPNYHDTEGWRKQLTNEPCDQDDCDDNENPADIDGNGIVNGQDLGLLLSAWDQTGIHPADINGDQVVNGGDLGIVLASWE